MILRQYGFLKYLWCGVGKLVSHQILILAFAGSSPATASILKTEEGQPQGLAFLFCKMMCVHDLKGKWRAAGAAEERDATSAWPCPDTAATFSVR